MMSVIEDFIVREWSRLGVDFMTKQIIQLVFNNYIREDINQWTVAFVYSDSTWIEQTSTSPTEIQEVFDEYKASGWQEQPGKFPNIKVLVPPKEHDD